MPVTYLPRRRCLPANDPPGFTPSYHHTRFDPADSNHDRRAARTRLQPLPTGSRVKHLSTIDSTLFHGFSGKCHFYAILSTDNPIHVSTRASTLPLTHDETGSARHTHSHRLARSPKATDSLLLTRRQQRPTGRQSQACTGASSPSKQDQARGLDSTPYHIDSPVPNCDVTVA